jgi:hypothetical protein
MTLNPYAQLVKRKMFWVEVVILALHLPPFMTFEFDYETMGNIAGHRCTIPKP